MKLMDKEKMWDCYRKTPTPELREKLIIEYAQLVKLVAGRLSMYLGHNVEFDDLVSYGIFGLIDAIDKFDTDKNVKFETYESLHLMNFRKLVLSRLWMPHIIHTLHSLKM